MSARPYRFVASVFFSFFALLPAARAESSVIENAEVQVEWDFSRRSAIQGAPFSRQAWQETSTRVLSAGEVSALQASDQLERTWTVQFNDGTVRRMLQRWADDAGFQLLWDVPRDYPIEVEMKLHGKFRDVMSMVVKSLAETDAPVQASFNMDIRLIRVVRFLNGQAR